jgi:hypothetical protein
VLVVRFVRQQKVLLTVSGGSVAERVGLIRFVYSAWLQISFNHCDLFPFLTVVLFYASAAVTIRYKVAMKNLRVQFFL